jgi:excisionase family DNA binding protein
MTMIIHDGPLASRAPLMTVNDVAAFLGINVHVVYRAVAAGELHGFKIGGRKKAPIRVRIEDVERWANA